MRKELSNSFKEATTLTNIRNELVLLFEKVKQERGTSRIGYVAGIVTSDGEEHMQRNMKQLGKFTERIKTDVTFPVFSSVDIFGNGVYDQIQEFRQERALREKSFIQFWRNLFESGHITDVFMTPRWQESKGATDEHETAKRLGITIHYVE